MHVGIGQREQVPQHHAREFMLSEVQPIGVRGKAGDQAVVVSAYVTGEPEVDIELVPEKSDLPRVREFLVRELEALLGRERARLAASAQARLLAPSRN